MLIGNQLPFLNNYIQMLSFYHYKRQIKKRENRRPLLYLHEHTMHFAYTYKHTLFASILHVRYEFFFFFGGKKSQILPDFILSSSLLFHYTIYNQPLVLIIFYVMLSFYTKRFLLWVEIALGAHVRTCTIIKCLRESRVIFICK